jgi:Cft2 family RNA processing exonuclease
MLEWADALKIRHTDLYLDSRAPRAMSFISHAHADHIATHDLAIATPATAALTGHRIALKTVVELDYNVEHRIDPQTTLRLLPAGHVLGSAMLHVTRPEGTLLYTGDFKLRRCQTVPCAAPVRADVLVTESTYGRPVFRFPPRERVVEQLVDLVGDAMRGGRQPVVLGYSLGKAQEAARVLTDAGLNVTLHGAAHALCEIYERLGVPLGRLRRYRREDFHGPAALDLCERGVLVAPPHVARTSFVTAFDDPLSIVLTGWAILKDAKYRYGVDHALPMSDHADFDELLELVEIVRPRKVYAHHGFRAFVDELKKRGVDAEPACPDPQLSLFE